MFHLCQNTALPQLPSRRLWSLTKTPFAMAFVCLILCHLALRALIGKKCWGQKCLPWLALVAGGYLVKRCVLWCVNGLFGCAMPDLLSPLMAAAAFFVQDVKRYHKAGASSV